MRRRSASEKCAGDPTVSDGVAPQVTNPSPPGPRCVGGAYHFRQKCSGQVSRT